jgi:hypothetical protein
MQEEDVGTKGFYIPPIRPLSYNMFEGCQEVSAFRRAVCEEELA